MFAFIADVYRHLRVRASLLYVRLQEGWDWLVGEFRDVQIAFILMLVNQVVFLALTRMTENNLWARIGVVTSYPIYLYVVRKVAVPIWFVEVGLTLWRRATNLLPPWAQRIVGNPRHDVTGAHHHEHERSQVWHETSVGGHVFHVISTIWMWSEVLLMACGIFPVWENGWFSMVLMITTVILFFVATEDFVDIKKWRARLGYAVAIYTVLFFLGPATLRLVAPGTFERLAARWQYTQTIDTQKARSVEIRTENNRRWQENMDQEELTLLNKQRMNLLDPATNPWTADDERRLEAVQDIKAGLRPEEDSSSKGWMAAAMKTTKQYPVPFFVLALALFAGVWAATKPASTGGHH